MRLFTNIRMYENTFPNKRYKETLEFLESNVPAPAKILDLGVKNPFSEIMVAHNYEVQNTKGEDLDLNTEAVQTSAYNVVTAFEIFEHLVAPYNVLTQIEAKKIVDTVPLKVCFSNAYRSKTDMRDRHYHEFEYWQFDWLLEKAGWKIISRKKWTNPVNKLGIRPVLRYFTPRYYAVYAERI